jgi:hypothetical protein
LINDMPLLATRSLSSSIRALAISPTCTGLDHFIGDVANRDGRREYELHDVADCGGDTVVIGGNLGIVVASVTNRRSSWRPRTSASPVPIRSYTYGAPNGNNTTTLALSRAATARGSRLRRHRTRRQSLGRHLHGERQWLHRHANVDGGGTRRTGRQLHGRRAPRARVQLGTWHFGGNGLTRYLTRPVTLADGFDARDLRVTFDAYRPVGSKFYVYYKVLPGDADTARFNDQVWRRMDMETANNVISTGYFQFKEFSFVTPSGRALDASTDTTDKFKVFAVKIVVASSDTVDVPRLANFRAIALDA